jgi:nicotinamidase-related amidase
MDMDDRLMGWGEPADDPDRDPYEGNGRRPGAEMPGPSSAAEASHLNGAADAQLGSIRSRARDEREPGQAPVLVDRTDMLRALNGVLEIDPRRTAVITIDCHRGHLDLAVATMPVAPQAAASVVASTARLLRFARGCGINVVHVIGQNRILPEGQPEVLCNPFWAAVEVTRQPLTPDRETTISRHNLVGTVQTQLMPELGPEPGDVMIDRKRRLSVFRDTDLDITLRELGVDTVILAGVNTNTTVLCAAFEAMNRDLQTIVVSDCVDSMYGDDLHVFALQNVARCLGWVLTVDELAAKVETRKAVRAR